MRESVILKLNAGNEIDLDVIASYITPENGNTFLIFSMRENQNGLAVLSASEIKNINNKLYLEKINDENWAVVKNLIKTEIEGVQIAVYNTELNDSYFEPVNGEYRRKLGVPQESLDILKQRYLDGLKEFNIRAQAPKIDVAPPVTLEGLPGAVAPQASTPPEPVQTFGPQIQSFNPNTTNVQVTPPATTNPVMPQMPVMPDLGIPNQPVDTPVIPSPQQFGFNPQTPQNPGPVLPPIFSQEIATTPPANEPIVPINNNTPVTSLPPMQNPGVPYIEPPIVSPMAANQMQNMMGQSGITNDVNIVDFLESLRQRLDSMEDVIYQVREELNQIEKLYE